MSPLRPLEPVAAVGPIREIDRELETLLAGMDQEAWQRPAVKDWRVRDVAAHLLDSNLRRLSLDRDGHLPGGAAPPADPGDFRGWVAFLDRLNDDWIRAAERLSPAVILDLLRRTNPQVADYFDRLDPAAPATFAVHWARPDDSRVWLDVAREYTEKWHHQQQIRDAVGAPGLEAPHLLVPLVETLLRAVPRAYDPVAAEPGTSVLVAAPDLEGARWVLRRDEARWNLYAAPDGAAAATAIRLPSAALWRVLMKQKPRDAVRAEAEIEGEESWADPLFDAVAVMA